MTYNITEILEIMKDYHIYIANLQEATKYYASVGVAQYGIEASMPKAQGHTSDVVATEALRDIDELPVFAQMRTDVKYINDRLDRVEGKLCKEILGLRLEGMSIRDIGLVVGKSKTHVHRLLIKIAEYIKGDRL